MGQFRKICRLFYGEFNELEDEVIIFEKKNFFHAPIVS